MTQCSNQQQCYHFGVLIEQQLANISLYNPSVFPLAGMVAVTLNVSIAVHLYKLIKLVNEKHRY
jgi:hypothetical protein